MRRVILKGMNRKGRVVRAAVGAMSATALVLLAGCHLDMWRQEKVLPQQESAFFADGEGSRPLVPGVVSHKDNPAELRVGNPFYTGIDPTTHKLLDKLPPTIPLNVETLRRGQERFNIFCSPCHGRLGDGKGMIAQRGLALRKQPRDFHDPRMLKMPLGHYYDVITNGFGVMYSYAQRVPPEDRWKIAAYVRVLQYSQEAPVSDVPPEDRPLLDQQPTAAQTGSETTTP